VHRPWSTVIQFPSSRRGTPRFLALVEWLARLTRPPRTSRKPFWNPPVPVVDKEGKPTGKIELVAPRGSSVECSVN
jgi:hypothetical protein